jgi:putative ABC transport system ATP-binding protein
MMGQAAIAVRDVTKIYASGAVQVRALDGVDLDVNLGEVLLLMGPSGSGKTTLLSIMGCILQATSGSVRIHNREVVGLSERKLPRLRLDHFGFVFQGFNLFPALSAGDNVALALDLKGVGGQTARRRAAAALERVGLEDKYDALPANLSGGQKQRVAIARALVSDPEIILADEPSAALDSHNGRIVMDLLLHLARAQGRAVVIVTHDHRAVTYGDRIVYIEDGKVCEPCDDELTVQTVSKEKEKSL